MALKTKSMFINHLALVASDALPVAKRMGRLKRPAED
jgi:hypothetical protein